MACPTTPSFIKGCDFANFLVTQEPVYDKLILEDIRPMDSWIGHVATGEFPAYSGVEHTLDRFNHVYPDVTKAWRATPHGSCQGNPCDKTEYCIGWGSTRIHYHLEEQSWATPLLCFDQDMHLTAARDQFRQIISKILKPATSTIMSNFMRKRAITILSAAGNGLVANTTMSPTTFTFVTVGDSELFMDATNLPTSKLTPQMLQRQVSPLQLSGYHGTQPFKDSPPFFELVSDMETVWELDKLANSGGVPGIAGNWRFEQWSAANKFWRYGFNGQLGDYMTRVDPMALRFNLVGAVPGGWRFQVVLPYRNVAASASADGLFVAGLKSEFNPDWQNAQYTFSFIWHKQIMEALVADATPVNPEMPFSSRNFGGKWQFVMDNLGADCNGNPIENKRRNKGQFIADFKLAIRPLYTEFGRAIFHKREPACLIVIPTCNPDPGYPVQANQSSCNCTCSTGCANENDCP